MPLSRCFVFCHFAAGAFLGLIVVAALFLGDGGVFSAFCTAQDRVLPFLMLAATLVPLIGLGCLGTALCFASEK